MKIFEQPGEFLKKLAKILFVLLLICGIILLCSGLIHMGDVLDRTSDKFSDVMAYTLVDAAKAEWKADGYTAKMEIHSGIYILLSSLATIPLYGFGQLIEDVNVLAKRVKD